MRDALVFGISLIVFGALAWAFPPKLRPDSSTYMRNIAKMWQPGGLVVVTVGVLVLVGCAVVASVG